MTLAERSKWPSGRSRTSGQNIRRVPGGLLHTNVLSSALFAAVSDSSAASTATVGRITTSELNRRGYSQSLALGSWAGAGSLDLLIPPTIVLIIYGVVTEASIAKLFIAGVVPGLMISAFYAAYHPQTQSKNERWHQTWKNRILLENYYLPGDLW